MSLRLAAVAAAVAGFVVPGAAGAQVLMQPDVSSKMALTIAEAAGTSRACTSSRVRTAITCSARLEKYFPD